MDILNPDLSYNNFLRESKEDISSTKALLNNKNYSHAIYHFQQSVEKSCKYLGLTINAFTIEKLKRISHNPQEIFDLIFSSKMFIDIYKDDDYKLFKNEILELDTDERAYYSFKKIQEIINNPHEERIGKLHSEIVVEYYRNNPFSIYDNSISLLIENAKVMKGYPKCEEICEQLIVRNDEMEICVFSQMLMSFLVVGTEATTRYPNIEKGTTPSLEYTEDKPFVKNLVFFIEVQEKCIQTLNNFFMDNINKPEH